MNFQKLVRGLLMILAVFKKELIVIVSDPGTRKVLVVPIVVQCIIFGYGANYQLSQVPYAAFAAQEDNESRELMQRIAATPGFTKSAQCHSLDCVRKAVSHGDALIGIYFGPDFKNTREVEISLDARQTASANTAAGYVQQIVASFNAENGVNSPLDITYRQIYNENNITRFSILTGMILALTIVQVVMLASLEVSREREEGSFDMMLMTPANSFEMLVGKALPPVIVSILQSLTLAAICNFYFDIPLRGTVLDLFLVIALFSCACVGIGLTVSVLSKTSLASIIIAFLIVLPSIMISGLLTPVDAMPDWFKVVARVDPLYYGVQAVWRIYLQGESFMDNIVMLSPLFGISIVTFATAGLLFRKNLD